MKMGKSEKTGGMGGKAGKSKGMGMMKKTTGFSATVGKGAGKFGKSMASPAK